MYNEQGFTYLILALLGFGVGVSLLMVPISWIMDKVNEKDRKSWVTLPDPKKINQHYEVTMWVTGEGKSRGLRLRTFVFVESEKTGRLKPQFGTALYRPIVIAVVSGIFCAIFIPARMKHCSEDQQAIVCGACLVSMLLIFGTEELMKWVLAYRKLKKEIIRVEGEAMTHPLSQRKR